MREREMSKENKKRMSGGIRFLVVVSSAVVVGILVGIGYLGFNYFKNKGDQALIGADVVDELGDTGTSDAEEMKKDTGNERPEEVQKLSSSNRPVSTADYSQVVDNVMPAVVSVDCKMVYSYYSFFGYPEEYEGKSSGTGFIIGLNGDELLIATNNHVIADSKDIEVTFADSKKANATVKGSDSYYDLAVISVDVSELEKDTLSTIRIATVSDSDSMKVGSAVIAIGNSMGYGQSITAGYISALNREIDVEGTKRTLIQTDAAINPGNSGGPLLNIYGEVIGINSAKLSDDSVEGMGYAIPMSIAVPIINELMNRVDLKKSEIGYLGVNGKDVNQNYSVTFGMPTGVYVFEVVDGSPAANAGICVGDVITALNGRKLSSMNELKTQLSYIKAGTEIVLSVASSSKYGYEERDIKLTLSTRP